MSNNLAKALVAGVLGGIVATRVKSIFEDKYPVRAEKTDSPPVVLAERVMEKTEHQLVEEQKKPIEQKIHWLFGVSTAVIYSLAVEEDKKNKKALGMYMGGLLYAVTHGSLLPLLKTEPWPLNNKKKYVVNEFLGHLFYGFSTEIVRRTVRKMVR